MAKIKITLRNYLVTGVLVLAPIGLTFWLIRFLLGITDGLLKVKNGYYFYAIPQQYHPDVLLGYKIPFLGLALTLALVFIVGIFARNFFGRKLIGFGEEIVHRIPFVRSVYNATKQLLGTILDADSMNFREVILVEYPRKGLFTLGFISGKSFYEIQGEGQEPLVSIFIPTTPNPTSGFFMLAPKSDLIHLNITPEEAFKLIISFGIVTPESGKVRPKEMPKDI